ncbi:MAG TPA: 4-(cytidine 5'-diphospho)-2-C-methyl-D-erythritol kinase [Flavobacteriales bacterium]|nr:4-(cytidine 5'-diphospho)-2-C-methyl-D-erythritol kinase [Flavobacteriales bacterium]
MIAFPQAKINLGLNVVDKRPDSFHDIETVMMRIPLSDALEIVFDPVLSPGQVGYSRSGLNVDGDPEKDLVLRAIRAYASILQLPALRAHLHKAIPMGAGLGGGSSDAAYTLTLLDRMMGAPLGPKRLHVIAASLGSDCPFFLEERPQFATGRGEQLCPVDVDLAGCWLLLVNPGVHVPTAEVYSGLRPSGHSIDLPNALATSSLEDWGEAAPNSMEPAVFAAFPEVRELKDHISSLGAAHTAMSGSGSSVFGIFRQRPKPSEWPKAYRAWTFQL